MHCRARVMMVGTCVAMAAVAVADSHVRIVRISDLTAKVQVRRPDEAGGTSRWTRAMLNAPVVEGERIRTFADGSAEIQLECGSAVRLTPNTELTMPVLSLRDDGVRLTTIRLTSGTVYATIQKGDAAAFRMELPGGGVTTPDGKVNLRLEVEEGATGTVEVLDGRATVTDSGRGVSLEKHHRLRLGPDGPAPIAVAASDSWSRWSHERDEDFHRTMMAQQPQPRADASTSAMPGINVPSGSTVDPDAMFNRIDIAIAGTVAGHHAPTPVFRRLPSCGN